MRKEYLKLHEINGPLIVLTGIDDAAYGETVSIKVDNKEKRLGKVIKLEGDKVIVQVYEGTSGISTDNASVKFLGEPLAIPLSKEILG
ncbi:MAG TPA: V-type ATP synthase subunit B, partial [Sedimentibacter sp.]|nr:V-type ATP synthase subunit B [Sedimentibacter sp.]